jgi:hypothetical protein
MNECHTTYQHERYPCLTEFEHEDPANIYNSLGETPA